MKIVIVTHENGRRSARVLREEPSAPAGFQLSREGGLVRITRIEEPAATEQPRIAA
jgi:hypothetical protein